eukprot:1146466-Pelagomonas_calceolata.AAC.4
MAYQIVSSGTGSADGHACVGLQCEAAANMTAACCPAHSSRHAGSAHCVTAKLHGGSWKQLQHALKLSWTALAGTST